MTDLFGHHECRRQERLRRALETVSLATIKIEPKSLIAELAGCPNVLISLHSNDYWNTHVHVLYAEVGDPESYREQPLAESWTGLLAWALDVLQTWSPGADPTLVKLSAAFIAFSGLDAGPWYWHLVPAHIAISAELEAFLQASLPTLLGEIQTTSRAELWEAELAAQLLRADAEGDWGTLEQHWQITEALADTLATPLVGCVATLLARSGTPAFVRAIDTVDSFIASYALLERLNIEQRLRTALASRRPAASFAAVISSSLNRAAILTPVEQELMEQLLIQTAGSIGDWRKWMTILNRYPVRRPSIQTALGAALACISDEARQLYCDSIELSAVNDWDPSRSAVGACLAAFRGRAPAAIQREMWTRLQQRWTQWIGSSTSAPLLIGPRRCQIDYGVIAYYAECLDAAARQHCIDGILESLSQVRSTWYPDRLAYESANYRLLSALQPCCSAHLRTPHEWLNPQPSYEPKLEQAAIRYRDFHLLRRLETPPPLQGEASSEQTQQTARKA